MLIATAIVLRAEPKTFTDLTLKDGQVLHNVTIVAIGSTTVMAKWDGGRGTIPIDNLPDGIAPKPVLKPQPQKPAAAPVPGSATPAVTSAPPPGANFQTPWQTESQYIVTEIASDLTEMAYFAKHQKALPKDKLAALAVPVQGPQVTTEDDYAVTSNLADDGQVSCVLRITGPIWAPESYRALTDALFEKLALKGAPNEAGDASDVLHVLLEPTVEHLVSEDNDVSVKLAGAFASSAPHERAALLMAAFEARDPQDVFYQPKFELCRTTAHLAFAAALRGAGAPTTEGKVARALLAVLHNNEADALRLAKDLPEDKDVKAWQRVIRMRATFDYRIFKEAESPTLIERFERLRAYNYLGPDVAWADAHLTRDDAVLADWWRISSNMNRSVPLGHTLLSARVPVELREAKIAYEAETGSNFTTAGYGSLNAEPQRCVSANADGSVAVRVIGWGTWAAFLQRELCAGIYQDFNFLQHSWGVPDEASSFRKKVDDMFWELRLYPFVRHEQATDRTYYHQAQDESMALVRHSPEIVPALVWNGVCYDVNGLELYIPPPHAFINEWHRPNPPHGTAFNPEPRMNQPSLTARGDYLEELERMHTIAPYDSEVTIRLLYRKYANDPPADKVVEAYGPAVDYLSSPCAWIAMLSADIPGAYEKWMQKGIANEPGLRLDLAFYYAARGRDPEAASTFDKWLETEQDEVTVANNVEWLVEYKERTGDEAGATALAQRAYKAGSNRGMLTLAHLLENRGLFDQAYRIHAEIHERYNDVRSLICFLMRMKKLGSSARKDSLLEDLLKQHVPNGLLPAPPVLGAQPPTYGAKVYDPSDSSIVTRLKWNDVIVSMNGYKIERPSMFRLVRELNPGAPLEFVVWRDNKYVALPASPAKYMPASPSLLNLND